MAPLTPLKLYRGDPLNELVESFSGFTDLQVGGTVEVEVLGNVGGPFPSGVFTPFVTGHGSGATLLDYSDPTAPTIIVPGVYLVVVALNENSGGELPGKTGAAILRLGSAIVDNAFPWMPDAPVYSYGPISCVAECVAGDVFQYLLWHDTGAPLNGVVLGTVTKIG